jgi:uncharacterized protein (TIGR04255 family)
VSWRNDVALFLGPRLAGYSAVDVEDLTTVELRSRELAVGHLEVYRAAAPGFSDAFLMLGAPQIGVRHSRRLACLRNRSKSRLARAMVASSRQLNHGTPKPINDAGQRRLCHSVFDRNCFIRSSGGWVWKIEGWMNWEPSRADHSIDRATVSIVLAQHLDANTFDEIIVAGRKGGAAQHLTDRVDLLEPLEIAQPGAAVIDMTAMPPRRVVFRRLDADKLSVDELSLGSLRIAFGTLRYGRWGDFFGRFEACLSALEAVYPIAQNARTVRLEYVDRFNSTIENADHFEVIKRDSEFLAPVVASKTAALHVHCGWFDFETVLIRQLTAINIDVSDAPIPPPPQPRRTVSVLSVSQFEALQGTLDRPVQRLDGLHDHLKSMYRRIITSDAAKRVGLND